MVLGKRYTLEDIGHIALRRKWHILVPFLLISVGTAAYARRLPDQYRSEASILIVPQRVPETYVRSTITTRIDERLRLITQQVRSRTRLEPIIREFNLYQDVLKLGLMEDAIERMRRDVDVQTVRADVFRVAFTGNDRLITMRVTERLASMVIDENARERAVQADGTSQFLQSQLADARGRLVEQEKRLETYRKHYSGQLPTQLQSNLQQMQHLQAQIQALVDAAERNKDRRLSLKNMVELADAEPEPAPAPAAAPATRETPARTATLSTRQRLDAATTTLRELEVRLKPEHPDVIRAKRAVADLEQKVERERAEAPPPSEEQPPVTQPPTQAQAVRASRIQQMRVEIESLERQISNNDAEQKRLEGLIAACQQRIDSTPTRESELVELTRDYDTLRQNYTSLLMNKEHAQVAANLERRQIGEQFRVLDPARLPEKPASPNRLRIDGIGAALGLAIGLGLAVLLEYGDTSLKNEGDVAHALALPVLALIPIMLSDRERKRLVRRRLASWTALTTVTGLLLVVAAWALWQA